jgi:hypothetical protein
MDPWPVLPYTGWKETCATLHLWLQIAGKVRLAQSPWFNHRWHVTLYVTARGLTTSVIPHGTRVFQIDFDFIDHRVAVSTSDGTLRTVPLEPQPVAAVPVRISKKPNEVPDAVAFDRDETHRAYDPEYARRFWRALAQADRVFKIFRARFRGKCSPVHFFWGSADLAVSRFSGRTAPEHPGGFWAGGERYPQPVALPGYEAALGEYVLPYDAVRSAAARALGSQRARVAVTCATVRR